MTNDKTKDWDLDQNVALAIKIMVSKWNKVGKYSGYAYSYVHTVNWNGKLGLEIILGVMMLRFFIFAYHQTS